MSKTEFNKYEEEFSNCLRSLRSIQSTSNSPESILVESEGELSDLEGYLIGNNKYIMMMMRL
jgi:hypothetical protein